MDFGISSVQPLASAVRELDVSKIGYGRQMELAHDCIHWLPFIL